MAAFLNKYFNPGKSVTFYCLVFFLVILFSLSSHYTEMNYKSLNLTFVVNAKQDFDFAIYYDVGRGLTEQDHQSREIENVNEDVKLHFCIPVYHRVRLLRIDPSTKKVEMTIKNISFSYDSGKENQIPISKVKPLMQIESYEIVHNMLHFITTSDGNDPNFVVESNLSPPEKTQAEKFISLVKNVLFALLTAFFLRFVYLFFIRGI